MKYHLKAKAGARRDIRSIQAWYEGEAPHMTAAFEQELDTLLARIEENPLLHPKIYGEIRRALMHRFRYAVYYTVKDQDISVHAILHQARDEGKWKRSVPPEKL